MKNKIELFFDDKNEEEVERNIGYLRLIFALVGKKVHIIVIKGKKKVLDKWGGGKKSVV